MMSSKSELTKTIDTQNVQIERLQQKLLNVVTAYKSLKQEKDALESTVRVLSTSAAPSEQSTTLENDEASSSRKEGNESGSETDSSHTPSDQQTVQDKLQTLQQNMVLINDQKNRLEQMLLLDKRKLKTENDELKSQLEEVKAENIILKDKFDHEIKELKNALRRSQRENDRGTADHGLMVRELQALLSTERNKSETMEHQFDECRARVVTLESQLDTLKKQHNQLNTQYQTKVNEFKEKDSIYTEELKRSKEGTFQSASKLKDIESKHVDQLREENKRNQQLEKKLIDMTSEHAQKVSTTETHIADLSEQVGVIEKQRAQDQMAIQRLKERIAQLDMENSLLTKASSSSIDQEDDDQQDLDTLLKRISKLKVLIRVVNDRFGKSLTIEDVLNIDREMASSSEIMNTSGGDRSTDDNKILHSKCQEEIDRLKSELEKYRNKTVAAFKVKNFKDTTTTKENDDLRSQIDQLREKLISSQLLYNSENDRHTQVVDKLQICLTSIREQHRHEMDQVLTRKRVELNELECELEKQRDRTVRLLSEKDRELETMKKQMGNLPVVDHPIAPPQSNPTTNSTTILTEFFPHHSSSTIGGPISPMTSDNNLLYFIQEQQLREQELLVLRKQRHELELTIRDLHKKYSFEINQLQATVEQLNDDLEHMKLSTERNEGLKKNEHNIDYIKNVFYHYLLSNDHQVKHTMANALMTILHFSTKEKAKVEGQKSTTTISTGGWFNSK